MHNRQWKRCAAFKAAAKSGLQLVDGGGEKFAQQITVDELVKSRNSRLYVIPAKAGIGYFQIVLDSGVRRSDEPEDFLRDHQIWAHFEKVGMPIVYKYKEKDKLFNKFHRPDL